MLTNHLILASEIGLEVSPNWMTEDDERGHKRETIIGKAVQGWNASEV